jgi:hypothetical protein
MFVKRLLSILVLSLVLVQLLLPSVVNGTYSTPLITTLPATEVAANAATLNATAILLTGNDGNNLIYVSDTYEFSGTYTNTIYFQYGTVPGVYTHTTTPVPMSSSNTVSTRVTGLNPCTRYYARAVLTYIEPAKYHSEPHNFLFSFLSGGPLHTGMHGLGVGLGFTPAGKHLNLPPVSNIYGNIITFTTTGCQIGVLGGGSTGNTNSSQTTTSTIPMANIIVQSAVISTPKVAPGEKVDVTASVTNEGGSNGDAKVTLYVNGQEVESQGVTLSSGQTSPLHFFVSRNEPGTYTVTVGGVSAGSFTVDVFTNNDFLIYGIIALLTLGVAGTLYLVTRKRSA